MSHVLLMFQIHIFTFPASPGRSGVSCESAVCLSKIQGKKGDGEEENSVLLAAFQSIWRTPKIAQWDSDQRVAEREK